MEKNIIHRLAAEERNSSHYMLNHPQTRQRHAVSLDWFNLIVTATYTSWQRDKEKAFSVAQNASILCSKLKTNQHKHAILKDKKIRHLFCLVIHAVSILRECWTWGKCLANVFGLHHLKGEFLCVKWDHFWQESDQHWSYPRCQFCREI